MKRKAYLIIDIGTGNSRAGVISTEGEILAIVREDSVYYEDHDFESSIYFKPDEWSETIFRLAKEALEKAGDVEIIAVSSSSQRQGIVLIGKDGSSLMGFPNSDMRGAAYIDNLNWDRITEITGLEKDAFYSCLKVLGTEKKQPETAEKIKTYTSISDWIGYLFTGKVVWERAQAAHTLAYDIRKDVWTEELCELIEADYDKLPPIAHSGTVLGAIKPEILEKLGLKEGTVFVVGAADTQIALVGVQAEKGDVVAVNGTTTPMTMILDEYRKVPFWLSPHTIPDQYMLEVNCGATGINVQRLKDKLLSAYTYEELEDAAIAKGKVPKMLAMFSEQYQVPQEFCKTVGFLFEEEIEMMLEPCDFLQAMMIDVAFQIAVNYRHITEIEPSDKPYILGCGGGFKGRITAQALADISGKEVWLPEGYDQGTMYGCLHLCNQAMGQPAVERKMARIVKPQENPELKAYYEKWRAYREKLATMNDLTILG